MSWSSVEAKIEALSLSDAQRTNVLDLISAARNGPVPTGITSNPYDGGLSVHWLNRDVAVYDDRYETYRFGDGETEIAHWPHIPSHPIEDALLVHLRPE